MKSLVSAEFSILAFLFPTELQCGLGKWSTAPIATILQAARERLMPATLSLTEDAVHRLAPDTDAVQAARGLIRKKSFLSPGISADATWLLAECQGSGRTPYEVSIDLADPSSPTFRCTCPSRKFPCKHGLGLLLLYAQSPEQFGTQEPSEELLAKREKKAARA